MPVVQTVRIDIQNFSLTEPVSNLACPKKYRAKLLQDEKGNVIAFYKIKQLITL